MGEEISGRQDSARGETHVLGDHCRMMVATPRKIGDQLRIRKCIRIDGLNLPMFGNGRWFAVVVPIEQLFSPQLLREDLFSALKALWDFRLRSR